MLLARCDSVLLLQGTMAHPPRTTTTKWRVWAWLPLMQLRVSESQVSERLRATLDPTDAI